MPKYVVSSTLTDAEWNNTTILRGDVASEVAKLRQELDGEIVVPASYQLANMLYEHDLVDELRVVLFPVVLGAGRRMFGESVGRKPMRLIDTRKIGEGLVYLAYERPRDAE
jgi:dihydrofolate reductase